MLNTGKNVKFAKLHNNIFGGLEMSNKIYWQNRYTRQIE